MNRNRYKESYELLAVPIFVVAPPPEDRVVFANTAGQKLVGHSLSQLEKLRFSELFFENDKKTIETLVQPLDEESPGLLKVSEKGLVIQKRSKRKKIVDLEMKAQLLGDESFYVATLFDVTHYEKAQEELKVKSLFNNVINNMSELVFFVDIDGKILSSNTSAENLLGVEEEELAGRMIGDVFSGEYFKPPELLEITNGNPLIGDESEVRSKDGGIVSVVFSARVLKNAQSDEVQGIVVVASDITKLKDIEGTVEMQRRQLVENARMSALGEIAGNIAHEINNPLAIIKAKSDILLFFLEKEGSVSEKVEDILGGISNSIDRIVAVIRGLTTFSKDGADEPFEIAGLRKLIDDSLLVCRSAIEKTLQGEFTVDEISETISLACRPSQVSQALVCILMNSREAVQDVEDAWIKLTVEVDDEHIRLLVTDCGGGIAEETAAKIFEPFFSTKNEVKGVGLGLCTAKGFIESNNGEIYIDSSCANTRFVISLPRVQKMKIIKSA